MKTLIINAHPRCNNKDTFANQMQAMFLKKYNDEFPNDTPDILNLIWYWITPYWNGTVA